jgi:c-di-GMP-binding flagellar brake protein YcgR
VADQLVFRVTDTFRIGQRRAYSRVPGRYPVTITPIDGDGAAVAATTADVSAGGLRLAPLEAPRLAEHNEVVIDLDGQPITARAVVVRHDPAAIGMRYTAIDDGDRLRIAQIALAWHQEQMMQATKAFDGGAEQLLG